MKKKILLFSLAALMVAPVLTSCKKGENDPFLSLKSRKSRLTGEWTLKEGSIANSYNSTTYTTTYTSTESTFSYTGSTSTTPYTRKFTVNKDNTYENVTTINGDVTTTKGTWAWLSKSKGNADLKNKEAIILFEESETNGGDTDTETGTSYGTVMVIDQLKSKEMIVKVENTYVSGSTTDNYEGTLTFEKK